MARRKLVRDRKFDFRVHSGAHTLTIEEAAKLDEPEGTYTVRLSATLLLQLIDDAMEEMCP